LKDPIVGVTETFLADSSPNKINLGVGAYRDDDGKPVVLQCVREAEARIAGSEFLESISSAVASEMVEESAKLVYGAASDVIKEGKVAGVQALSGTGACRLFAEFQRRFYPESGIYLPNPTWSNHHNIWRDAQVPLTSFQYYNPDSKDLNFGALMDDIKNAPDGSFFLLHPCAHNPTGVDPTEEQWREISYQFKPFSCLIAKYVFRLLDGYFKIGLPSDFSLNILIQSFGLNYVSILCATAKQAAAVKSQLQQIARAMYSSPPIHGVLLVSTILNDQNLKALWVNEIQVMANRIRRMRTSLRQVLEKLGSLLNWEHITNQVGMFASLGLIPDQVDYLQREFHIYMTDDGRISVAGVTPSNVSYLANAIHEVTKPYQNSSSLHYYRSLEAYT
ncbi:aspartate aminotransferase, mitochondrial-like, partial [Carica papaya]|uniref:aspartate aminotransferase, mitochondrial-like n=1 Tax=Carica papaya TaxID=3649 RepID=UPI000B8CB5B7